MKKKLKGALFSLLLLGAALIGGLSNNQYRQWQSRSQERAVAALPGVGAGWLDTLRRVAGGDPVTIDTINAVELDWDGRGGVSYLLGLHEPFHNIISIRLDMKMYAGFVRLGSVCGRDSWGYQHPVTVANPPAVVAHEFGHHFAMGSPFDGSEEFADRFSRAMMALRGWDTPDSKDVKLYHLLRYRLLASYWPKPAHQSAHLEGSPTL